MHWHFHYFSTGEYLQRPVPLPKEKIKTNKHDIVLYKVGKARENALAKPSCSNPFFFFSMVHWSRSRICSVPHLECFFFLSHSASSKALRQAATSSKTSTCLTGWLHQSPSLQHRAPAAQDPWKRNSSCLMDAASESRSRATSCPSTQPPWSLSPSWVSGECEHWESWGCPFEEVWGCISEAFW